MKRLSLTPDDTTYELILREAYSRLKDATPTGRAIQKKAVHLVLEAVMLAYPSDSILCDKCGKLFSIEADEGSIREEGAFCNKHVPKADGNRLPGFER